MASSLLLLHFPTTQPTIKKFNTNNKVHIPIYSWYDYGTTYTHTHIYKNDAMSNIMWCLFIYEILYLKRHSRFAEHITCFANKYMKFPQPYYANTFSMTRSTPAIKLSWSSFFPQDEWMKTPSCSYTTYNKAGNEIKNEILKLLLSPVVLITFLTYLRKSKWTPLPC